MQNFVEVENKGGIKWEKGGPEALGDDEKGMGRGLAKTDFGGGVSS